MSDATPSKIAIQIQPVVSYPREAEVGKSYLTTVDVKVVTEEVNWPYQSEELELYCMIDSEPIFTSEPLGEPVIVLNRFGGSYGPASFMLKASSKEVKGNLRVNFLNRQGILVHQVELADIRTHKSPVVTRLYKPKPLKKQNIGEEFKEYFRWLYNSLEDLSLTAIDLQTIPDQSAQQIDLRSIYVFPSIYELDGNRATSAIEVINKYDRLVLLGDPGSGKTSLLNYIALCMSGEALQKEDANLSTLNQIPSDTAEIKDVWDHGLLLPVKITLRDFAARRIPDPSDQIKADDFWSFLKTKPGIGDFVPEIQREFFENGGLLLLDGLDEIPQAEGKREQIRRFVGDISATLPKVRIIVSSRLYAHGQEWRFPDFSEAILTPFNYQESMNLIRPLLEYLDKWELRDLCFELSIDYDILPGSNKSDKARELVEYCLRHSLLPELVHQFTEIRPHTPLSVEVTEYISSIKRLNRPEWLQAHGFVIDPFSPDAFKAETDPLIALSGTPAFVDPPDIERLIGTPASPGYRFIFAPDGGGKTSLRHRIFNQFTEDLLQWYPGKRKPLILPVEYILHDYNLRAATIEAHIRRIARLTIRSGQQLLMAQSEDLTTADFQLDLEQSLDDLIQNMATTTQRWGLDGICVLIDNLERQPASPERGWSFIQSLAAGITDLLSIDGFMFKFFCPPEFLPLARSILPSGYMYEIKWTVEHLDKLLEKRLALCTSPDMIGNAFADLFDQPDRIKSQFIAFGQALGAPAQMWQLGHYFLEDHFERAGDRRQPVGALIRYGALDRVLARLTQIAKSHTVHTDDTTPSPHGKLPETGKSVQGWYEEAITAYREAIARDATDAVPYIHLFPEQFGSDVQTNDNLYGLLSAIKRTQYALNLANAGFIKPMGVVALALAVRRIAEQSGHPVRLVNLDDELLAYLERVNLFTVAGQWLQLDGSLPEQHWDRNPRTANLLELTPITNTSDVIRVMERAEAIFSRWLQLPNLGSLLKVISELCSNIYQHSGDPHGFVLIQRYRVVSRNEADVILAVGDMGQGIRGSLVARHPELGTEPLAYIQAALEGSTSRYTGRGGLGLRTVEETIAKEGGYLWLRSETAAIRSYGPDRRYPFTNLAPMPGTQVVVEFRAPLRD